MLLNRTRIPGVFQGPSKIQEIFQEDLISRSFPGTLFFANFALVRNFCANLLPCGAQFFAKFANFAICAHSVQLPAQNSPNTQHHRLAVLYVISRKVSQTALSGWAFVRQPVLHFMLPPKCIISTETCSSLSTVLQFELLIGNELQTLGQLRDFSCADFCKAFDFANIYWTGSSTSRIIYNYYVPVDYVECTEINDTSVVGLRYAS